MKKLFFKLSILVLIIGIIALVYQSPLTHYLTLDYLKANQEKFQIYYHQNRLFSLFLYSFIYIIMTALSLPGAAVLTLAGGAFFGLVMGTLVVSFSSTIGASLAFIISRFLLRDWVQEKFKDKLRPINEGIEKQGALYLFSLRLIPAFPFFVVNLVMGLTQMPLITYFFVSQIGMLLGTIAFVNAGVQLSQINSLQGILSFKLLFSFAFLGLLPLMAKKIMNLIQARKVYRRYKKPKKFDYNMIVIGGGSAGLVTAYICATLKAKVALIEKHKMGGDCLNTGCVPSKALIKSASLIYKTKESVRYGIKKISLDFEFAEIMERVQEVIKKIEPHDSIERYTKLGVDCLIGKAKILSPWEIKVGDRVITTRHITVATGASPMLPPFPGLDQVDYLVSGNLWDLRELPKHLLILGAGPVGLEMAQCFRRFGSQVSIVQRGSRILAKEDPDVSAALSKQLEKEGIKILVNHDAQSFRGQTLIAQHEGRDVEIPFDRVLIALGRKPNIEGFGLEDLGVRLRKGNSIEANPYLQTNYPNIWVCGDVTGPFQLTHAAAHQAWFCAVNALLGRFKKFKVNYSVLPWATFTDPEVATVGKNEEYCKSKGIDYEVTQYGLDDLDRAIADGEDYGFVKVLTKPKTDKILGATIVGAHASDLLLEFVAAMKQGFGLNAILGTIHAYPTRGEANKYVAGHWKKAHKPERILNLLKKYHRWERGHE